VTPDPERGTPLRADAARNRERVLRIAREQLAAGDDSLMLNSIARLAGVGVGTVYRHFPTRHALLEALLVERFQHMIGEVQAAAAEEDAVTSLHRLLRLTLQRMLEDSGFAAVFESDSDGDGRMSAMKGELELALTHLLDRACEAGAVRPDLGADDVRRLICGIGHAVRIGDDQAKYAEIYLAVLLEGLRPPR
jgi:AcrR family transcriptional regulator